MSVPSSRTIRPFSCGAVLFSDTQKPLSGSVFATQFMKPKILWVILPVIAIGLLVTVGLVLPSSLPQVEPSPFNGAAITMYQVNVGHIVVNLTASFQGGIARVEIPVSAIPYSLRVTDSRITTWRILSQQSAPPLLQAGDSITVRTQSTSYTGKYTGVSEGYLVLEVNGESVLVKIDSIVSIELRKLAPLAGGSGRMTLVLEGNLSGVQTVTVSFLARGMGWLATSGLDLSNDALTTEAFIWSSDNWTDASVKLVVGEPTIVFGGDVIRADLAAGASVAKTGSTNVEMTGPYYAFALPGKTDLNSGEQLAVQLQSGEVRVVQFNLWQSYDPRYVSSTEQSAELSVNVTNILRTPIPWGYFNLYEGTAWIGSTSTAYIPVSATRTLSAGPSHDIGVISEIISSETTADVMLYTVQITARNYGQKIALVVLKQSLPTPSEITAWSGQPAEAGTTLTWTISMEPGDVRSFTFTFEVPLRY